MSGWGLRGWNPGRWSPFGRSGEPAVKVTDADYSYISAEDLDQHTAETRSVRPKRSTDVLVFRHNTVSHPVHVAAYSIDDGEITVGVARELAAKRLHVSNPRMIQMYYKGRKLKDDTQQVYDCGIRSDTAPDIMCVIGDATGDDSDGDSDDSTGATGYGQSSPAGKKKRNRRGGKKAKKSGRGGGGGGDASDSTPSTPVVEHLPMPSGAHPLHKSSTPSSVSDTRVPSPAQQTPQQKLQALIDKLRNELVPLAEQYIAQPPSDKAKRDFEYKRLSETILAQVLLKTDAVETEGNEDARQMRKGVVREAQDWLNKLDEVER